MKIKLNLFLKKWESYKKIVGLGSKSILILLTMSFFATVSEILGLGIFYPIVEFIQEGEDISTLTQQSDLWVAIINMYALIGLKISLKVLLISAFLLFISRQIFLYIKATYRAKLRFSLNKRLKNTLFSKYLYSNSSYQESLSSGDISEVIVRESSAAVAGVLNPVELISYAIMLIIFLSTLIVISWEMTISAIIVLIITSLIPRAWIKSSAKTGREAVAANIELSSFIVNRLKLPRLVRLSGMESAEIKEFSIITEVQREKMVKKAILANKTDVVMEPVVILLSLIFLYVSVTSMHMPLGQVGLYVIVAIRLLPIVKGLIMQLQSINSAIGSIEVVSNRICDMDSNKEIDGSEVCAEFNLNRFIEFNSVYFIYPNSKNYALSDITFKLPSEKITAIVGPSGGGKSTLIDLLPRLRDPTSGNIYFDNILTSKICLKKLRDSISYASQNPQIFNVTVAQHIKYGKLNATMSEVKYAATIAGISEFIDTLPFGYDTLLGEGSVKLSGGQQQKLDLARVLVRNPKILIFDEPTSGFDPKSEKEFEKILYSIRNKTNITILIVSHSLGVVSNADQIIVLKDGSIESIGRHADLINFDGWYKEAWSSGNTI